MRFRLNPTPTQEQGLLGHCSHARFMWNLALEHANWYRPQWSPTPDYASPATGRARWHVAFAQPPLALHNGPTGAAVGVDRGVANTLATGWRSLPERGRSSRRFQLDLRSGGVRRAEELG